MLFGLGSWEQEERASGEVSPIQGFGVNSAILNRHKALQADGSGNITPTSVVDCGESENHSSGYREIWDTRLVVALPFADREIHPHMACMTA